MIGHVVTVGTSLLSNRLSGSVHAGYPDLLTNGHPYSERPEALQSLFAASAELEEALDQEPLLAAAIEAAAAAVAALQPDGELSLRPRTPGRKDLRDFLPQELSYLWTWAASTREAAPAAVRLLCSDTPDSKACGAVIASVLQHEAWKDRFSIDPATHVLHAAGVTAQEAKSFRTTGLHNWMARLGELIEDLQKVAECDTVYLNVTGGYKGTVPYSTLRGMFEDPAVGVRLAYLFEESPDIIEIPAYPIGVDFRMWHANARRLKMQTHPVARPYFKPDPRVNEVVDATTGQLQPFGKVLEAAYNREYGEDPLQTYATGTIERLLVGNGTAAALRNVLTTVVANAGDVIWVGDKLPGMVDHSLRHHHDLLEIAESFLSPILKVEPSFLNPEERFVLLAAVLLHDCGHTLDLLDVTLCQELEPLFGRMTVSGLPTHVALFPSDVRDYHQVLAGLRLSAPDLAADLSWPGREGLSEEGLPDALHDAVVLACLYHRRRVPYREDHRASDEARSKGTLHLTGQFPGALDVHPKSVALREKHGIDLMKVVALLRLIDGCDSQAHRAGRAEALDVALGLQEREVEAARLRAQWAVQALPAVPPEFDVSARVWNLKDADRSVRIRQLVTIAGRFPGAPDAARWLTAADAIDRWAINAKQLPHQVKHLVVKEVEIVPDSGFAAGNLSFTVVLHPSESGLPAIVSERLLGVGTTPTAAVLLEQSIFLESEGDTKPLYQVIEEEVSSEYDVVASHARDNWALDVKYRWQGDWQSKWHNTKPTFYP